MDNSQQFPALEDSDTLYSVRTYSIAMRNALTEPWTPNLNPTFTAVTTNPTLGATGSHFQRHRRIGSTGFVRGIITLSGAGASLGAGILSINLPFAFQIAPPGIPVIDTLVMYPGAGGLVRCSAILTAAQSFQIYSPNASGSMSAHSAASAPAGIAQVAAGWTLRYAICGELA